MTARLWLTIGVIVWLACGIAAAGVNNASFRAEFPALMESPHRAAQHHGDALLMGFIFGPVALLVETFDSGFYQDGWTLSRQPTACTYEAWCNP